MDPEMIRTHIFRVILVGAVLALGSCLQRESQYKEGEPVGSLAKKPVREIESPTTKRKDAAVSTRQLLCPLMGEEIDKKYYVDHDGKRIYVCCAGCVKTMKKKPEQFIRRLESKGIELESVSRTGLTRPNKDRK